MSENAQQASPLATKAAASPTRSRGIARLHETARKHEQLLQRHRATNASLVAFKERTEAKIATQRGRLEIEHARTCGAVRDLEGRRDAALRSESAGHEARVAALAGRPSVSDDVQRCVLLRAAALRAEGVQMRAQFLRAHAAFLDELRAQREATVKAVQGWRCETARDARGRVAALQERIAGRCEALLGSVDAAFVPPRAGLAVSDALAFGDDAGPAPGRLHPRFVCPSAFLAAWAAANAHLLDVKP